MPIVILQVYDRIVPNQATATFTLLLCGLLVAAVVDGALRVGRSAILTWNGVQFEHKESLRVLERILHSDLVKFESNSVGTYLNHMDSLRQLREFFTGQTILMLVDLPFVAIFLALIWVFAGSMVLIPVAVIALFMVASYFTGRRLRTALKKRSDVDERRHNFLIEALQGIHTIKALAMEASMLRRYERLQSQSAESVYDVGRINSIVQGLGATFSQVVMMSFVGIGSIHVIQNNLTVGALAAGTMLSGRVLQPALKAMGLWTQVQSVRIAREKLNELLSLPMEAVSDRAQSVRLLGHIELRNIHFRHESSEEELLSGISLKVEPGEAVGISGLNGVGKSTLVGLMMGFMRPTEGEVLLDGRDIRTLDRSSVGAQIALMPQRGVIFEGTILENLTLFREGAAINQALEIAEALGLTDAIRKLPQGLDTRIGGANVDVLPAGVRQQIILARSVICDPSAGEPRVILFDDANSCLDLRNDSRLLDVFKRLKGDRTLVIISHRPSFLRLCDRQYSLLQGCLSPGCNNPLTPNPADVRRLDRTHGQQLSA